MHLLDFKIKGDYIKVDGKRYTFNKLYDVKCKIVAGYHAIIKSDMDEKIRRKAFLGGQRFICRFTLQLDYGRALDTEYIKHCSSIILTVMCHISDVMENDACDKHFKKRCADLRDYATTAYRNIKHRYEKLTKRYKDRNTTR